MKKLLNRNFVALLVMLIFSSSALAQDFERGLSAAERGDYLTAFEEWYPLAIKGDELAQYNLGIMYEMGRGVPRDEAEAVKWYRKAAKKGNNRVLLHLATMYSLGKGGPTDFIKAYMYYYIAADKGDERGVKGRDLHAKLLAPMEILKAQMMAQEWLKE